jgi:hypothetical protein
MEFRQGLAYRSCVEAGILVKVAVVVSTLPRDGRPERLGGTARLSVLSEADRNSEQRPRLLVRSRQRHTVRTRDGRSLVWSVT